VNLNSGTVEPILKRTDHAGQTSGVDARCVVFAERARSPVIWCVTGRRPVRFPSAAWPHPSARGHRPRRARFAEQVGGDRNAVTAIKFLLTGAAFAVSAAFALAAEIPPSVEQGL